MAKLKKVFYCRNCGQDSPKWQGKCPACNEWNTLEEEMVSSTKNTATSIGYFGGGKGESAVALAEIEQQSSRRITLKDAEFTRVLGGGIVEGSTILLGGEPGIGKSTLLLQTVLQNPNYKTCYVGGEESPAQIKLRAERIGKIHPNCFLLNDTNVNNILKELEKLKPNLVIVDSVQTLYSDLIESIPGSISQIRGCTGELIRYAKTSNTPIILVGHITKDGNIAGPKLLEHMVDVVLQFEGDRNHFYRLLRSLKNRFGSTHELGIYEMMQGGLSEVQNPSAILVSSSEEKLSGSAIGASLEGIRPLMIEVQALVSTAAYGTPQRSATGFDNKRLNMLLAVLEKRCRFNLATKDVFLNIAGGLRVNDPSLDLAVVVSVLSSGADIAIDKRTCFAGEVGLSGEIRPVTQLDQRIQEAEKLGYKQIFISKYNPPLQVKNTTIQIHNVGRVDEVFKMLLS